MTERVTHSVTQWPGQSHVLTTAAADVHVLSAPGSPLKTGEHAWLAGALEPQHTCGLAGAGCGAVEGRP